MKKTSDKDAERRLNETTACPELVDLNADSPEFREARMPETRTPRTDAATYPGWINVDDGAHSSWHTDRQEWTKAETARQLERELSSVTQRLAEVERERDDMQRKYDVMRGPDCYGVLKSSIPGDITTLKYVPACVLNAAQLLQSGEAQKDAARYQQLFDAELLFVGEWATEEAAASGEGPWVMLMKEQADIALDALASLDTKEG